MDEGDDYVPQLSQLGADYSGGPAGAGPVGYGPGGGLHPMAGGPPQMPPQYAQMMMHGMPPNPYMHVQPGPPHQPPQQPPPVQPPAPAPPAPKKRNRSKKATAAAEAAAAAAGAPQSQPGSHPGQTPDPMASMAALSHNPMMRPAYAQQMAGYGPPHGFPPQHAAAAAAAYRQSPYGPPHQHLFPGQPNQQPQTSQPQSTAQAPRPGVYQQPPTPSYNPYYPAHPQQMTRYPGHMASLQQQHPQYFMDPRAGAYYGAEVQPGQRMPPQGIPGQMPDSSSWGPPPGGPQQGQSAASAASGPSPGGAPPGSQQGAGGAASQLHNPYAAASAGHDGITGPGGHPTGPVHPAAAAAHAEMVQCQQHLQRLYTQQRTPILEQEIGRYEQQVSYLRQQLHPYFAHHPGMHHPAVPPRDAPPGMHPGQVPPGHPGAPSSAQPGSHSGPPVSVTQGTNQIQVNIKPEQSGHTLISVYHQHPPPAGYPGHPQGASSGGGDGSSSSKPSSADSIPPEPIPSSLHQQQQAHHTMHVPNPYGGSASSNGLGPSQQQMQQQNQMQHQERQQHPAHLQQQNSGQPPHHLQSPSHLQSPQQQHQQMALQHQLQQQQQRERERMMMSPHQQQQAQLHSPQQGLPPGYGQQLKQQQMKQPQQMQQPQQPVPPPAPPPPPSQPHYLSQSPQQMPPPPQQFPHQQQQAFQQQQAQQQPLPVALQPKVEVPPAAPQTPEAAASCSTPGTLPQNGETVAEVERVEEEKKEEEERAKEDEDEDEVDQSLMDELDRPPRAPAPALTYEDEEEINQEQGTAEDETRGKEEEKVEEEEEQRKEMNGALEEDAPVSDSVPAAEKSEASEPSTSAPPAEETVVKDEDKEEELEKDVEREDEEIAEKVEEKEEEETIETAEVEEEKESEETSKEEDPEVEMSKDEKEEADGDTVVVDEEASLLLNGDAASASEDTTPFTAEATPGETLDGCSSQDGEKPVKEESAAPAEADEKEEEKPQVVEKPKKAAKRRSRAGAGSSRRKKPATTPPPKTKKRKPSLEESDQDDDYEVSKKRRRKQSAPVVPASVSNSQEDFPIELLEKRRSGRTKQNTQRYAAEAKEDEVMRELDDMLDEDVDQMMVDDQGAIPYVVNENSVVEKVLKSRKTDEGVEEFLIKFKGRAYVHCEWCTAETLDERDKRSAGKLKRFKSKRNHNDDDEEFNSDYTIVERVLSVEEVEDGPVVEKEVEEEAETSEKIEEEKHDEEKPEEKEESEDAAEKKEEEKTEKKEEDHEVDKEVTKEEAPKKEQKDKKKKKEKKPQQLALVKWRSLPYDELTWEPVESVPEEKVDSWRKRQIIDKAKAKEKARPEAHEWKKLDESKTWKDGNKLREYQFEGVNWLLYCYHHKQNCILADEMGLGKTVQTITFLSQVWDYGIHGPFLIVVPLSTVHNWMREFETWTDMNVVVYHGSSTARQLLQHYEFYYEQPPDGHPDSKSWRKRLMKLDAIITTFEMVVTDVEVLRKIPFRLCVIDEAHRLKNRNCKLLTGGLSSFSMEHRVLLTGTPLQNNIEELFSLLNFLSPAQFSSPAEFLEKFGQCKTDEQVQALQDILKPMMLRRLKEDVEKTLQPKEETIIEVQLSDTQKKYYRAILERNFSHLCKGSSQPALMNAMMELRKCCNHPFLIQGAEENVLSELKLMQPELDEETLLKKSLVNASGKMVLIDKLLPKLKADGHKVLIFSQMVKVLDLIEEYLVNSGYTFERIDGNVRGDVRQAAIDRFSKPDADRFVFLLCTRAGGLGINLTAADTVIIFDSDWNPQNDLQAQARCHRIGQTKTVKVYRLITANTYEREMFEKASLKLGLDKAVLQSTHALRENSSSALTRKEVEELLKKGAYGSIMDEENEGSKFNEEDIDTILQRRTTTITLEAGVKGSTFSKATFNSSANEDIDIDDPNFWSKWAQKANVDAERALAGDEKELIVTEPRQRKKRFEPAEAEEESGEDSQEETGVALGRRTGRGGRGKETASASSRKRRRGAEEDADYVTYRPDELAFNKSEYFRVEKQLASWSWGRWGKMKEAGDLEVTELDVEHMARTLLLHCLREFRGDERTRDFIWRLISPSNAKATKLNHRGGNQLRDGWAALPEYNPPNFALDSSFQRHVHRHANKLLGKVELLHHLEKEMLGPAGAAAVIEGKTKAAELVVKEMPSLPEPLCPGWDAECDKSLIIGCYRYGLETVESVRTDELLCFVTKGDMASAENFPASNELQARARRLITQSQRNVADPIYEKLRWSRREEQEFMRILRSWGMKDRPASSGQPVSMDWDSFRSHSPLIEKKSDAELQEQLYCTLAMCTRVAGNELSPLDTKRALAIEALPKHKAERLMSRLHLTRKVHAIADSGMDGVMEKLKVCSVDQMPSGWTSEHDRQLVEVCSERGIENISVNILNRPLFQKIVRPGEKDLLRRVMEICMAVEAGQYLGVANVDSLLDSDDELPPPPPPPPPAPPPAPVPPPPPPPKQATPTLAVSSTSRQPSRSSRKATANAKAAEAEKEKMRLLLQQQNLLQNAAAAQNDMPLAMLLQAMMMPQTAAGAQQSAALLQALFSSMPSTSSSGPGVAMSSASSAAAANNATAAAAAALLEDVINLSKKESAAAAAAKKQAEAAAQAQASAAQLAAQQALISNCSPIELLVLSGLPQDTRIPMEHTKTRERLVGESAPRLRDLLQWMTEHTDYRMDLSVFTGDDPAAALAALSAGCSIAPSSSRPSTSKPSTSAIVSSNNATPSVSAAPTPKPSLPSTPKALPATPVTVPSPRLEPGEIPRVSTSSASASLAAAAASLPSTSSASAAAAAAAAADPPVAVCSRQSGALLPSSQWPSLSKLIPWLAAHPESNVHPNGLTVALPLLATMSLTDRIQGADVGRSMPSAVAPATSSASSAAAAAAALEQQLQLSLMLQSSMLNPFGMLGLPGLSAPSVPTSMATSREDALNQQLLLSMFASNPAAMMQSMLDPSALLAAMGSSMAGSSGLSLPSSLSSSVPTRSIVTSTPTVSSSSNPNTRSKSSKLNKLHAVVEKLSNQSSS